MSESEQAHYVRCLKCSKILKCPVFDASCLLDHIRSDHPEIRIDEKSKLTRPVTPPTKGKPTVPETSTKPILTKSEPSITGNGGGRNHQRTNEDEIEKLAKQTGISSKKINTMAGFAGISKDELASAARKLSELSETRGSSGKKIGGNDESSVVYNRRFVVETQDTKKTAHSKCKIQRYTSSIKSWCCSDGVIYCPECANTRRPLRKSRAEIISPCCAPCILRCWPFCILPCAIALNDQCEYLYCCNCKTFLGLYNPETNSIRPNKNFVQPETQKKCCSK